MLENIFKQRKYGLALGSGGAKGFVHIGVIKALEDLDIEITHIGGSSAGSLVGGLYALWKDINKVENVLLNYDKKSLLKIFSYDVTLSKGVFKGENFIKELDKYLGNTKIEDCSIPFVAVSVDIQSGEKIYHTSGLLKDAIRASCSIPGVFTPYELNSMKLIDGGLVECVPVRATKNIGAKKIIGVNIEGFPDSKEKINLKSLTTRVYHAAMYNLGKSDLELADKQLQFNLSTLSMGELIDNAKKYIKMGYEETINLFD